LREVLSALKADPATAGIPVIVLRNDRSLFALTIANCISSNSGNSLDPGWLLP
jgi:hypothetical protein